MNTNSYPKISIITPSYNQGAYLEDTILSVLNQNYPNLEYIIIDGGSTDNSVEIIKQYQDQFSYWVSEPDKGTWEANNKGLERVTGDYWCVVNSDDLLCDDALFSVAKLAMENSSPWIASGIVYIDEHGNEFGRDMPKAPKPVAGLTFLNGAWISHPTVFLKKEMIMEVGLFEKHHLLDLNYWLRMEKAGYIPFIANAYFAKLRMHLDCKSADQLKLHEEYLNVVKTFIQKHSINLNKDVKTLLKTKQHYGMRLAANESLVGKQRGKSLKLLFQLFGGAMGNRWYWGLWKRFIFGVNHTDPLNTSFDRSESNANWN